jgi:hypothetical protein
MKYTVVTLKGAERRRARRFGAHSGSERRRSRLEGAYGAGTFRDVGDAVHLEELAVGRRRPSAAAPGSSCPELPFAAGLSCGLSIVISVAFGHQRGDVLGLLATQGPAGDRTAVSASESR